MQAGGRGVVTLAKVRDSCDGRWVAQVVVSSLQLVLQSLPSTAVVGFVSYSRSVSVYHLQSSDVAAAVVCSGSSRHTPAAASRTPTSLALPG